ncbi:MAG: tyrosine-type recombinase/integrase [Amaricoccus sp.]|uniref:tyrosine-type recombinase/integrase n=1 Tax=Amaricoccus sp. TaxID=1872485 RepID=UPI0039E5FE34
MSDHYLAQPKGPGTAFQLRMRTPTALLGTLDPLSGRPFGSTIRRGLGSTRDLREARVRAAILRGQYLALASNPRGLTDERALVWAELIAKQRATGDDGPDDPFPDLASLVEAEAEADEQAAIHVKLPPAERTARAAQRDRFLGIASGARGLPLDRLLDDYLTARSPGNRSGLAPLALTTRNDVRSAFRHLGLFLSGEAGHGKDLGSCFLGDMTADAVHRFRTRYLRERMAPKTASKYETLLVGAWRWAREERLPGAPEADIWASLKLVRRALQSPDTTSREAFTAPEVAALLDHEAGLREPLAGLFRLLLVTGCRVDEVARLTLEDVAAPAKEGASPSNSLGFTIRSGKTANAARYVPVPAVAQGLFGALIEQARKARAQNTSLDEGTNHFLVGGGSRLFPSIPIRPASGKAAAASQTFTRERRRILLAALGDAGDGRLALHSTRHTWRTLARRARVPEDAVNELGGWAGPRRSSSVYDHGMLREQLAEAPEKVALRLAEEGFLSGW